MTEAAPDLFTFGIGEQAGPHYVWTTLPGAEHQTKVGLIAHPAPSPSKEVVLGGKNGCFHLFWTRLDDDDEAIHGHFLLSVENYPATRIEGNKIIAHRNMEDNQIWYIHRYKKGFPETTDIVYISTPDKELVWTAPVDAEGNFLGRPNGGELTLEPKSLLFPTARNLFGAAAVGYEDTGK